jgi:glycosyltransferase involved in cell wall biosynthesis
MLLSSKVVSIILPVFNASKFLKEAIDSILSQSYTDYELIIINDGSTDNSKDIIQNYKDSRIRYFSQENSGVASTLNKGISLANGKYVWRHDADDISLPDKLEKQVNFLLANPEYDLCATQIAFMTESGKIAHKFKMPNDSLFKNEFLHVDRCQFNPYSPIIHATVLVRTSSLQKLGGFREDFITSEDIDLWLRLLEHSNLGVIQEVLYYVRMNSKSATQVHGWKNRFFKEKAFEYYEMRISGLKDDLELGKSIVVPNENPYTNEIHFKTGRFFNEGLIHFLIPLYLDAKDYSMAIQGIKKYFMDGWKLKSTWKSLLLFAIGKRLTGLLVNLKSFTK